MQVGEAVAVGLGLHHAGQQVVGRGGRLAPQADLLVDDARELGEAATDADAPLGLVRLRPGAVEQLLTPVRDLVVVLLGDPERLGRHRDREAGAEPGHQIAATVAFDGVEQPVGQAFGKGLDLRGRAGREGAVQEAPHPRVQGRVDLAEEALLLGHDDARAPKALGRREAAGVLERGRGVGVARGVDEALHRPRHRALGAQPLHETPHVLGLVRVERIERERRSSVAHAPPSSVHVVVMPVSMLYA